MRWYLLVMFMLPLLELWDRFRASHTQRMGNGGMIAIHPRWFGWAEQWYGGHRFGVFFLRIPYSRAWELCPNLGHEQYGWCEYMLVHISFDGPGPHEAKTGWRLETIPVPG